MLESSLFGLNFSCCYCGDPQLSSGLKEGDQGDTSRYADVHPSATRIESVICKHLCIASWPSPCQAQSDRPGSLTFCTHSVSSFWELPGCSPAVILVSSIAFDFTSWQESWPCDLERSLDYLLTQESSQPTDLPDLKAFTGPAGLFGRLKLWKAFARSVLSPWNGSRMVPVVTRRPARSVQQGSVSS